jgi:hypothetical protein
MLPKESSILLVKNVLMLSIDCFLNAKHMIAKNTVEAAVRRPLGTSENTPIDESTVPILLICATIVANMSTQNIADVTAVMLPPNDALVTAKIDTPPSSTCGSPAALSKL